MAEGCLLAAAEPAALLRAEAQRAREAAATAERTRVAERRQLVERYEALLNESLCTLNGLGYKHDGCMRAPEPQSRHHRRPSLQSRPGRASLTIDAARRAWYASSGVDAESAT